MELFKKVDDLQPVGAGWHRAGGAVGELDQRRARGGEFVCPAASSPAFTASIRR
jgi:hypothetical protein